MSLYLPECTVGALKDGKWTISGKDSGSRMSSKHEFAFKAGSVQEGERWHGEISRLAGLRTGESSMDTPVSGGAGGVSPSPPAYSRQNSETGTVSMPVGGTPPAGTPVQERPAGM